MSIKLFAWLSSGQYLACVEHIALYSVSAAGGAQFCISCAQIDIMGGGNGMLGLLVASLGAYKATGPGLLIDIYHHIICLLFDFLVLVELRKAVIV